MKWPMAVAVILALCLCLFGSYPALNSQAQGKAAPAAEKITVLNPLGTPPPITLKPMASRLDTLEGKTIYVVDQGYLGTDNLLKEMIVWLEREYPKTNFVFKRLGMNRGGGASPVPALFAEIKEKGDAMIMGLGH